MGNTCIYSVENLADYSPQKSITFVFSGCDEKRSLEVLEYLYTNSVSIEHLLVISYSGFNLPSKYAKMIKAKNVQTVSITEEPMDFVNSLKKIPESFWCKDILIDISCIRIPEMFTFFKLLKMQNKVKQLKVAYSIPYDYVFKEEPFTSYRSYFGDLKMFELLGFSGPGGATRFHDLYMFLGFEGALGLKVFENCQHSNLMLVNNLPSFFPKYKDISVINNYQLMQNKHKYLYTPADNPFEAYNLLYSMIGDCKDAVCVAPLSTKPVALGICLFALNHEFVRVVYPVSNKYRTTNTLNTYKTNIYNIEL